MRLLLFFIALILTIVLITFYYKPKQLQEHRTPELITPAPVLPTKEELQLIKLKNHVLELKPFISKKRLSQDYCFLIDMSLPSGKKRFFVYDLQKDTIVLSGLVSHGSCNNHFLEQPQFSNIVNSGCSSVGRYKIGYSYKGNFGKAYKLYGLDSTNSQAFNRAVVLHAYDCVPDYEVDPQTICNSLGCPMISYKFLSDISKIIDHSQRPILLWIFE